MTSFEPANISNTLLEIKNLSVDYHAANGTVHALTDVSITLGRGQILGLAGESGTTQKAIESKLARIRAKLRQFVLQRIKNERRTI